MSFTRMVQALILLTFIFGIGGVAKASDDAFVNIHSVAVISAMGDDVGMYNFGTTIFTDVAYDIHTDWNVDAQIVSEVTNALADRFTVKNISVDPQAVSRIVKISRAPVFGPEYDEAVAEFIRSLPKSSGIDAYVIVLPGAIVRSYLNGRNEQGLHGTRDVGLFNSRLVFEALYFIGVYDAVTGKRIELGNEAAVEECSSEMWETKEDSLTAEQKSRIRQEIFSLTSRSIPYSLARAHLISDDAAKARAAQFTLPGDPSCHKPGMVW